MHHHHLPLLAFGRRDVSQRTMSALEVPDTPTGFAEGGSEGTAVPVPDTPTCFAASGSEGTAVPEKTISKAAVFSVADKISMAKKYKEKGNEHFANQDFKKAKLSYARVFAYTNGLKVTRLM